MKPSLHELIRDRIFNYTVDNLETGQPNLNFVQCDELAEQIIKIVRDYHLVEDDNYRTVADDLETIRDGGE